MLPRGEVVTRSRRGIRHRSRHSQFWGWRKVVPVCGGLNLSNSYSTGNSWSKRNRRQGIHKLDRFPHWRAASETSAQNEVVLPKKVFDGFSNYCCPKRWCGMNRISHLDWVKLCVELNYAPNKNSFCYKFNLTLFYYVYF